jgi:crotonobetainyl-CoA:carnitine CoA-transferase CaiB-like acyl-CoA transferase
LPEALLAGLRVVHAGGEPVAVAGRILGDLGAIVTIIEPPGGAALRMTMPYAPGIGSLRHEAWHAGASSFVLRRDGTGTSAGSDDADADPDIDGEVEELLAAADIVLAMPGWPGTPTLDRSGAPHAVWVDVTPFGSTGPHAAWAAGDLGILASSANLYVTGDPDRPPVRCAEPVSFAHAGPEIAFAALTAHATGRPQLVDVSMQEMVLVANMGAVGRYRREQARGRRRGANIGRTREIWPCADGFVSFGLRGGKARVASLETLVHLVDEAGLATESLRTTDWATFDQNRASDAELEAIAGPIGAYFATRTMGELYAMACATNVMLAPANGPADIFASPQLEARELFASLGALDRFPQRFVRIRSADGEAAPAGPRSPAPAPGASAPASAAASGSGITSRATSFTPQKAAGGGGAWAGTRIIEFGSGAAGPIATRYFAEQGATVIRVESRSRPDFLRTYATPAGPGRREDRGGDARDRLDRSGMFDALNVGKRSISLDLKHPDGLALARRLITEHADAVSENFAPKAMPGLGLDYDTLAATRPDLVMISACLNGQTGPHRDYPGFGGQGSALSGFNVLTGWPDREPIGPFGTITDSLAPRYVAAALASGLLYRARTGRGVYLDVSQVECALYALSPWLLDAAANGESTSRCGNADPYLPDLVPHGVYPCADDGPITDRWIAITPTPSTDWTALESLMGIDPLSDDGTSRPFDARVSALDTAITAFTRARRAIDAAEPLRAVGLVAVPVQDFADTHADPQLSHRGHLVELEHPVLGVGTYERNGFRLSDAPSGYDRPSPTLGQDTAWVLGEVLGLDVAEQARLREAGALD